MTSPAEYPFTPGDRVLVPRLGENWNGIVGIVVDTHDGGCTVEWPSGRRTQVANLILVHAEVSHA
jgi:hypothetical protein